MSAGCEDRRPKDLTHSTPGYRRALWLVAFLNLAMGAAEIIGGYLARSQALKADALDFLGDGAITLLGLLAIQRSQHWRASSALIQTLFLGTMGVGVFASTVYRMLVQQTPTAETMGIFGIAALAVNVLAAILLIPHRQGDANVRAVWLFKSERRPRKSGRYHRGGSGCLDDTAWPDCSSRRDSGMPVPAFGSHNLHRREA